MPLAVEAMEAAQSRDADAVRAPRRYAHILLVEDERAVAAGLAALLESEGLSVQIVETGRDVLPAIEKRKPDVVVLDIGLPDMEGTMVYQAIARMYPDMPVVFSSGHGDKTKLERHIANRHVSLLLKPYDVATLLETLDRVVA
jgi:CheY-like chemotaxis protein